MRFALAVILLVVLISACNGRELNRRADPHTWKAGKDDISYTNYVNVLVDTEKGNEKAKFFVKTPELSSASIPSGAEVNYAFLVCYFFLRDPADDALSLDGVSASVKGRAVLAGDGKAAHVYFDVTAAYKANPKDNLNVAFSNSNSGAISGCTGQVFYTKSGEPTRKSVVYWGVQLAIDFMGRQSSWLANNPIDDVSSGRVSGEDVVVTIGALATDGGDEADGHITINSVQQPLVPWDPMVKHYVTGAFNDFNIGPLADNVNNVKVEASTGFEDAIMLAYVNANYRYNSRCEIAAAACNFKAVQKHWFADKEPFSISGKANQPILKIKSKDSKVWLVKASSTSEGVFIDENNGEEIPFSSESYADGSNTPEPLSSSQFKLMNSWTYAGAGFDPFKSDAARQGSSGRCVKLFLNNYSYFKNWQWKKAEDANECVVFRTD
eukprot:Nk52_evm15s2355 gene=Nk52_evmTU15s2355